MSLAFEQLHPGVQRWIWQQGWPALRSIQADAIPAVLARETDVLISAPTAGGKTEAAFLPILSDICQFEGPALRCLCVSPLRALINDQARRLTSMADILDLTVQPWHGDVTAGRSTFWKRPAHVLITTPESLEAMLMRRGSQVEMLAQSLRYLVVDELHAFFGSERGAQLQSLLQRVERLSGRVLPRVALSATLGDPAMAASFLRPDGTHPVKILSSSSHAGEIRLQVRAIHQRRDTEQSPTPIAHADTVVSKLEEQLSRLPPAPVSPLPAPPQTLRELEDTEDAPADRYTTALGEVAGHLFDRLRGQSHLVFANARSQVELVADQLRERSESAGLPNEFFPHHGALSRELRLFVEQRLRDGTHPTTAICTSTLEMGIDIGDVTSIAQIGAAPSVASLKQRIGRSGRRAGAPQILRQYVVLPALDPRSHPVDWLRLPLLQAIAAVELMLEGRFEPPRAGDLHLSTFVQQILSVIAQYGGGATAVTLYAELCEAGRFRNIDRPLFADVLRALGATGVLEQVPDGTLLPGPAGERIMDHYSFYATFHTPEEYQLLSRGKRLGTMPIMEPLTEGQLMLFAGRRWQVTRVDPGNRIIDLVPSRGGRPPKFGGAGISVHRMVHERMQRLLEETTLPVYLDATAQQSLLDAREAWHLFGFDSSRILGDEDGAYLAHWAGTTIGGTIALWLQQGGIQASNEGPFVFLKDLSIGNAPEALSNALESPPESAESLALCVPVLEQNKFDPHLSRDVLAKGYAAAHLDLKSAEQVMRAIHASPNPTAPRRQDATPGPSNQ